MNNILAFLETKVAPFGEKVGNQRHLKAIREGFMMAMPLILVGSLFLILISWPQEDFTNWLNSVGLLSILTTMNQSTVAIISLVACFGIAYRLSEGYGTDGPSAGIIALSSFVLMAPRFSSMVYDKNGEQVKQLFGGAIPFSSLNASSLFMAITIGLVTAEIYRMFIQRGITIKMPSGVPDVVSKSFSALLPGFTTFVLWALVLKGLEAAGVAGGLNGLLGAIVGTPLKLIAGTLPGMILCPQLFTPNLKTIQNPCLSLDPGWFLFSPNGCFLLDKKEFPLYGISVEKNTKRKETHMNSLPNHHFQNKSFYQLSFDGGHLTQYGGLIFFQELFSQLKLKERISKYLATNDQRRYCRYSDSDILVQFLFQLLTGYGTDYACKELSADAYFPKLLEGGQLASQPTLSRFLSRTDEETVHSLRCLNLELVEFFLQFHQLNQLIVDIDSTHFTTYGKQEGVAYNAHYRAHGYHPLYAFEGKTGYCFNAQLRPGNRYCSEEADSFITPVLERFNQLLFRMDSGFATPKLYDLIEKTGQYYLIKLKKNTVLSRLGDLSLPCPQDEDLTILPHSAYSETLYQAGSWSHKRRVCQFSERKEGNLFYDVISLVTNMTSGTSQDQFQLYRGRGQAENFIKEMKEGFFGDKTDSSTLIKNEVRMMMSCIAYNLYLFLKHLAGGDFQTLTIKRFRHLFLHVVGKCVRTGRKQLLKLSSLYAYSELFSALYSRIRKVNLNLPVPYEPPGRKASLMMH
ncbi:IS1380-Spn1 transposase [Streptococcus pneumoniae]|nr:IS1380-Spn1 transposase [Streptococcus pneumoniae]VRD31983.1 IS1380-Spn1 transposase [Streptococcus pneumoniae]